MATFSLIRSHSYSDVSMRKIAAASGVAEKTLYNIFGSKDRLIAEATRDRSASAGEVARIKVPRGGWKFLLAFCDAIVEMSLLEPLMTRTMVRVLIDQAKDVDLNTVYTEYVKTAFEAMQRRGLLLPSASLVELTRLYRLDMVAGVLFWANGEITDEHYPWYLKLRLCQLLLPVSSPEHTITIARLQKKSIAKLRR